jgi:CP family cyanate transporter-like MFS transporter
LPVLLCAREDVARISAGMFMIGYGSAVVISILGGVLWDLTGVVAAAFLPIAVGVVPLMVIPFVVLQRRRAAMA